MDAGTFWEICEYFGEALVFVGVVGEVLAERELIFKEDELRRDSIEGIASWVLVVGLAASLAALIGTNEHFNGTIAALNKAAGDANERAARAEEHSKTLDRSTQQLKTDAEEAHKEAEDEQLARVKLEERVAWRTISPTDIAAMGSRSASE
jgi:hypothetical protein